MNNNVITSQFNSPIKDMTKTYEIKLNLTTEQISEILDSRLGQKIEFENDNIEELLNTAECIKSDKLSDQFCRYFTSELTPLLSKLVASDTDSYEITNFQHRMLRKFADCATKTKKTA
jgi:hypothetical protein